MSADPIPLIEPIYNCKPATLKGAGSRGHVYIFDRNGAFVCEALNYLRRGVSAEDVAAEKSKIQKRVVAEQRRELRATMRRVRTDDLAREILTSAGEKAGKVVRMALPRRQSHRTPDLEAAGKAARVGIHRTGGYA